MKIFNRGISFLVVWMVLLGDLHLLLAQSAPAFFEGISGEYDNPSTSESGFGLLRQTFPPGIPRNDEAVIARARSARSNLGVSAVRMIFSAHSTTEDGAWAIRQARSILREMKPAHTPLVIWIENAYPAALPQNVQGLQILFGETAPSGKNWYEELSQDRLSPESQVLLENFFNQAVKEENAAAAFQNTQNPFFKKLREGIDHLKNLGWKIRIEFEGPSFEAYADDLRRDVMSLVTVHWLTQNKSDRAMAGLGMAYQYISKSLETRDENLSSRIMQDGFHNPDAIHLVFRGLAHEKGMTRSFAKKTASFRWIRPAVSKTSMVNSKQDIRAYLLKYHELPSMATPHGTRFLSRHLKATRQSLSLSPR
ncbi:MAG: hypothetical protein HYZ84_06660 [Candidatus Omnitrophica bacterium]|nr:hypothetical protein [Candidatus Omnitrophota bacterium]